MRFVLFTLGSLILFLAKLPVLSAQTTDFQTWTSVNIQKSFSKKLDGSLSQELRLMDNSTHLSTTFTDIGAKYEMFKNFDAGIYFRFIINPDGVAYRPYTDVSYKLKMDKWSVEPRLRYQHQVEQGKLAKNYLRPKVTIGYKINKQWEPYLSGELFYHIFYDKGDELDQYRLSAGIEYDFNKQHSLKVFYLLDQEFNVNAAEQNHVAGAAYDFQF